MRVLALSEKRVHKVLKINNDQSRVLVIFLIFSTQCLSFGVVSSLLVIFFTEIPDVSSLVINAMTQLLSMLTS